MHAFTTCNQPAANLAIHHTSTIILPITPSSLNYYSSSHFKIVSLHYSRDTVKFNGIGKFYKVSLSFIEHNPQSMLARLTSDMWNDDPRKPILIDQDGDVFAYVLNCLFYGSIELTNCIPQSMFECEPDNYRVHHFKEKNVQHSSSIGTIKS